MIVGNKARCEIRQVIFGIDTVSDLAIKKLNSVRCYFVIG